ncbi:MAG: hypothetical protein NVS2B9_14600 [Myxococcales bacterium]
MDAAPALRAFRPPPWTALLNLSLGALFLASIPLGFLAVDRTPLAAAPLFPWLTVSFTGLFILAHESIHGLLVPGRPRLGAALGRVFAFAYAFMDYGRLRAAHRAHHAAPGTALDPDAHASGRFFPHLAAFLWRYLTVPQLALLVLAGDRLGSHGHTRAMLLAYVGPIACSTLIVFSLGIYLVHHPRLVELGLADARHRAVAVDPGPVLSLFAILFFNYHWLHHEHPHLTWVSLGRLRAHEPRRLALREALSAVRSGHAPAAMNPPAR